MLKEGSDLTDHVAWNLLFILLNRHVRRLRAAAAAAAAAGGENTPGSGGGGAFDPTNAIVPGSGTLTVSITFIDLYPDFILSSLLVS